VEDLTAVQQGLHASYLLVAGQFLLALLVVVQLQQQLPSLVVGSEMV
jgi:hypothetical protein